MHRRQREGVLLMPFGRRVQIHGGLSISGKRGLATVSAGDLRLLCSVGDLAVVAGRGAKS